MSQTSQQRTRIKGRGPSVLRFFWIAVAFAVVWILITSQLGFYSVSYGPQILLELNYAFYLPSIPVLLLSGQLEKLLDARMGKLWSMLTRLTVGLGGCLLVSCAFPFMPQNEAWLLGACAVLGSASSIALSTAYQLVSWFRSADTIGLGIGCVGGGPLVLLVQMALQVGPEPERWQWVAMFSIASLVVLGGLLSALSLFYQYWGVMAAGMAGGAGSEAPLLESRGGEEGGGALQIDARPLSPNPRMPTQFLSHADPYQGTYLLLAAGQPEGSGTRGRSRLQRSLSVGDALGEYSGRGWKRHIAPQLSLRHTRHVCRSLSRLQSPEPPTPPTASRHHLPMYHQLQTNTRTRLTFSPQTTHHQASPAHHHHHHHHHPSDIHTHSHTRTHACLLPRLASSPPTSGIHTVTASHALTAAQQPTPPTHTHHQHTSTAANHTPPASPPHPHTSQPPHLDSHTVHTHTVASISSDNHHCNLPNAPLSSTSSHAYASHEAAAAHGVSGSSATMQTHASAAEHAAPTHKPTASQATPSCCEAAAATHAQQHTPMPVPHIPGLPHVPSYPPQPSPAPAFLPATPAHSITTSSQHSMPPVPSPQNSLALPGPPAHALATLPPLSAHSTPPPHQPASPPALLTPFMAASIADDADPFPVNFTVIDSSSGHKTSRHLDGAGNMHMLDLQPAGLGRVCNSDSGHGHTVGFLSSGGGDGDGGGGKGGRGGKSRSGGSAQLGATIMPGACSETACSVHCCEAQLVAATGGMTGAEANAANDGGDGLEKEVHMDIVQESMAVLRVVWVVVAAFATSAGALHLVFPFFTFVRSSGLLGERLPQVLFYSRLFVDIVGRLLPRNKALLATSHSVLLALAAMQVSAACVFFWYLTVDDALLHDWVPALLVGVMWALAGYINTTCNILAPNSVPPALAPRASAIMALTNQVAHFAGLVAAAGLAVLLFGANGL